jgi:Arc/MetJ-type ribon-helix-helix transcriptional regulator
MADNVHELRPKAGDSEKITVNLGYVDLGHIDLMLQEGFYAHRTDFIRTAIRNQLDRHGEAAKRSVARKGLELGLLQYTRKDLEAARWPGKSCISGCWGSPASPRMSRPSSPPQLSPRSPCWEPFTPAQRSRPPWPTEPGDLGGQIHRNPTRLSDTSARKPRQASDGDSRPSPTRMLLMNETPRGPDLLRCDPLRPGRAAHRSHGTAAAPAAGRAAARCRQHCRATSVRQVRPH